MARGGWAEAIYPAAERFIELSLRREASFVTGVEGVWTPESADEFFDRFVVKEDLSSGSFNEKLAGQLTGARPATILLGVDLVCLCTLPVHDMGRTAKVERLRALTRLMSPEPEIDDAVLEALATGIASYGAGKAAVWKHMRYLAEFARTWVGLDAETRSGALADPWEWKQMLAGLPGGIGAPASAMLHMVFPDVFEPIVSVDVKASIGRTFARAAGVEAEADPDRRLILVRSGLRSVLGEDFQFWDEPLQTVWRSKPEDRAWTFATFARKFRDLPGFEEDEIDYKLELAQRLAATRKALLAGEPEWQPLLKRAFGPPNNITSWRQHNAFLKWCESDAEAAREALSSLWSAASTAEADIETFLVALPEDVVGTPGARANIVAFLLGAWEPDAWVNYKATWSDHALELVGLEPPNTGDVAGRIQAFSSLIDEVRVRVIAIGGPPVTRLEAQGMVWCVVSDLVPEEWSEDDRRALEELRGVSAPGPIQHSLADDPERAWLVRGANVGGVNRVSTWIAEGFVSVGWSEMGDLDATMSLDELRDAAKAAYPDESPGNWGASAGNLFRFLSRMAVGDLVVTLSADDVFVGRVTSDVYNEAVPHAGRRRRVEWLNPTTPFSRAQILNDHPSLYSKMRTLLTVTDLKDSVDAVRALLGMEPEPGAQPFRGLPTATDELAAHLFVPRPWLQEQVLDLLAAKRQLIFYGPPGTGKTYIAQRVAEHVVARGGDFDLVQFHPSYSYEDFFEGFRPSQSAGENGVTYALRDGPLKRIAALAAADPEHPYLLIVDEINRGNIPKIFGELLFLLEYRDRSIRLQYSEEPFSLPPNLFVIGTMNTADRSIALVDAALRRRFYFVPFLPTEAPVSGVLRSWLEEGGHGELPALLLDELNRRIAKDEVAIGPSYFMGPDPSDHARLRSVWRHAILPLLDEHYYGTKVEVRRELGFEACLKAVTPSPEGGTHEPAPDGLPAVVDETDA